MAPAVQAAQVFVPIPPCRVVDTRFGVAPFLIAAGETRSYQVTGAGAAFALQGGEAGGCGIPQGNPAVVNAVSFNFVAVGPTGPGHVEAWAFGMPVPIASTINYSAHADTGGLNIANGVIVPVAGVTGSLDLSVRANINPTGLVADVTGYFMELDAVNGLVEDESGPMTIGLAPGQFLPQTCAAGQIAAWDGDSWECADDEVGAGGGGTIESITSDGSIVVTNGSGPDTTIGLADGYALPQGCGTGQVPAWDGDSWECADDQVGGGGGGGVAFFTARHNQLSTSSGTTHYGPAGASNPTDVQTTLPAAQRIEILSPESGCTAQKMRVRQVHQTTGAPVVLGADAERTFTLLIDGSPSALTCTITAGSSTCVSAATAALAAGGQRLAIQDVNGDSGSYPAADALIAWECV